MKKTTVRKTAAKKNGRPSLRTPSVIRKILTGLAKGTPMAHICRGSNMPAVSTVWTWAESDEKLSENIARARRDGFDAIAAECLRIADTQKCGKIVKHGPDGITTTTEDMLGHRKLQIETRLKLLSKWDPKRYGDRLDVEHAGKVDIEVTIGGDELE